MSASDMSAVMHECMARIYDLSALKRKAAQTLQATGRWDATEFAWEANLSYREIGLAETSFAPPLASLFTAVGWESCARGEIVPVFPISLLLSAARSDSIQMYQQARALHVNSSQAAKSASYRRSLSQLLAV
jgi:hypothetical protein